MAYVYGVASYNSTTKGSGMCRIWDDTKYMAAWPYIWEMNSGTCDKRECTVKDSIIRKDCGSTVTVYQPCTGKTLGVTIADCGPLMSSFCNDTGFYCKKSGYVSRIIDLTPTAFAYLGGSLDYGTMTVRVTQ